VTLRLEGRSVSGDQFRAASVRVGFSPTLSLSIPFDATRPVSTLRASRPRGQFETPTTTLHRESREIPQGDPPRNRPRPARRRPTAHEGCTPSRQVLAGGGPMRTSTLTVEPDGCTVAVTTRRETLVKQHEYDGRDGPISGVSCSDIAVLVRTGRYCTGCACRPSYLSISDTKVQLEVTDVRPDRIPA